MKTTTSKQLAKTFKSGPEAAKLQNEGSVKGFSYENNYFKQLAKALKSRLEAAKLQNDRFEKNKKRVKITLTTSKQLAKALKSGHEAAKLENEEFVKGFPFENN